MSFRVIKADGSTELFKPEKLKRSLRRAGASRTEVSHILSHVEAVMHEGMRTQDIYRHAFERLKASETSPVSARYSMRRALFNLGPTGFPFEDFLAKLFELEGYTTKTRILLSGSCAEHELDVAAYTPEHSFVAEAKFHSRPGTKSDLQVALYSYARFLDLKDAKICREDTCGVSEFLLVTNTKFTSSAEKYARCVGLNLLSWDYPNRNNLHDRIQRVRIYPITVLQNLSQTQKRALIEQGTITCRDLLHNPYSLRQLHLNADRTNAVLSEASLLVESGHKQQ